MLDIWYMITCPAKKAITIAIRKGSNRWQIALYTKMYNLLNIIFLSRPKPNFELLITFGEENLTPHGLSFLIFTQKPYL